MACPGLAASVGLTSTLSSRSPDQRQGPPSTPTDAMATGRALDADVIIVGGGPAGTTLACLMASEGHRAIVFERDVHPRDHVGESLTPSNNFVLHRIGFLSKMEDAGFVHKEGVGWTAPRSPIWKFV